MNSYTLLVFTFIGLFVLSGCADGSSEGNGGALSANDAPARVEGPCPSLVGSWELISIADDSPALAQSDTDPVYTFAPTLKILNRSHWMFIRQLGDSLVHAQGGRYSLEAGGFYTEHVAYSALPSNVGKTFQFTCEVEGDSLWYHIGGLGDTRYRETWRRVQ